MVYTYQDVKIPKMVDNLVAILIIFVVCNHQLLNLQQTTCLVIEDYVKIAWAANQM